MIHLSANVIEIVRHSEQSNEATYKPNGIWYAPFDAWKDYHKKYIDKGPDLKYEYDLELRYTKYGKRDRHRVLKITDERSFDRFTLRYGTIRKDKYADHIYIVLIDWERVAKRYGGVELAPLIESRLNVTNEKIVKKYNKKFGFVQSDDDNETTLVFWQTLFDVPSGCVWNPGAIRWMKRIK